jgi:4-hydroxybenzoate polyprenyltransferase
MNTWQAILIALRPRDWIKNGIVLAALLDSGLIFDSGAILISFIVFLLLSALSSAIYLLNDIFDRERDRLHPTKKLRPIPAGVLPIPWVLGLVILLASTVIISSWLFNPLVSIIMIVYFLLQLAYSISFKHIPFVESITISLGFVLRLMAASAALGAAFSPWLNIACFFTLLFMTLRKRRYEVSLPTANIHHYRPVLDSYQTTNLLEMETIFAACSIVFYSLYSVFNSLTSLLALTIPFLVYGIMRYHHVADQPEMDASGQRIFTLDRPTMINLLLWIIIAACLIIAFGE